MGSAFKQMTVGLVLVGLGLGRSSNTVAAGSRDMTSATTSATATKPFILTVYCSGGWDQTMVFDNKIGSSQASQESGSSAATLSNGLTYVTNAARPNTQKFFTTYGDAAAIVNGIYVGPMDHRSAAAAAFGTVPPTHFRSVDWLSYYAATVAPAVDLGHVDFSAPFMPGEFEANASYVDAELLGDYLNSTGTGAGGTALAAAGETALTAYRAQAFSAFISPAQSGTLDAEKVAALNGAYTHESLLAADLQKANTTVGTVAGDDDFTHMGRLAVALFAQGSTQAATVQAGANELWDTTTNNYSRQTANYESLFTGLNKILSYAQTLGVDGNLVAVVMSEMGRAPLLNAAGGKGPWPYTSMLVWGQGIKGGTVAGLTDASLRGQKIDPIFGGSTSPTVTLLQPGNVWAAIYLSAGINLASVLPNPGPLALIIAPGS